MEKAIESFMKYQREAEERYQKWEEQRWQKETELEEKRRQEEQQHEMRLFQVLGSIIKPRESYHTDYNPSSYNFDYILNIQIPYNHLAHTHTHCYPIT